MLLHVLCSIPLLWACGSCICHQLLAPRSSHFNPPRKELSGWLSRSPLSVGVPYCAELWSWASGPCGTQHGHLDEAVALVSLGSRGCHRGIVGQRSQKSPLFLPVLN